MATHVQEEDYQRSTFLIDTKSTCFLCLDEIAGVSSNFDKNGEWMRDTNYCLRRIFQYLRLDPGKVFGSVSPSSPLFELTSKLLGKVTGLSVILCPDCAAVTEKLNLLCEELEKLQMKLDNTLITWNGKMAGRKEIQLVEIDEARNKVTSPRGLEIVHAMAADILREKAKEKCIRKLKTVLPRMDSPPIIPSSNGRIRITPSIISPKAGISCVKLETTQYPTISSTPAAEDPEPYVLPPNLLQTVKSFKLTSMADMPQYRDHNNLVFCGICPASSNSVFGKELLFQRHVICCHLDILFSSLKLPNLTMEQFKAYCEHVLEEEIKLSEQVEMNKKKNTDGVPAFVCHVCTDIFHETKVILVHLVQEHYGIIAEKLVILQRNKNVTPEQLLRKPKSDFFAVEERKYKCEECGRVFVALSSLNRHKKTPSCQQQRNKFTSVNLEQRPYVCAHCGLRFSSEGGRRSHTKRIHMGIDHNRYRTTCEQCGKTMSRSSIGRHKNHTCPYRNQERMDDSQEIELELENDYDYDSYQPQPVQSRNNSQSSEDHLVEKIEPKREEDDFAFYLNEDVKVEYVDAEEEDEDTAFMEHQDGNTQQEFY